MDWIIRNQLDRSMNLIINVNLFYFPTVFFVLVILGVVCFLFCFCFLLLLLLFFFKIKLEWSSAVNNHEKCVKGKELNNFSLNNNRLFPPLQETRLAIKVSREMFK